MNRKILILLLNVLLCAATTFAQEPQKSSLQQRAEAADVPGGNIATARSLYIHAFNDYANKGLLKQGVECAARASALYYKENYFQEAFDLLRRADQAVMGSQLSSAQKSALYYLATKERLQMYIKLRKADSAKDQLRALEGHATAASDEALTNDLLYTKAIYYYTFGMTAQGNSVFSEMAQKLTASKDYDKVDEAYKTLIANGRRSNSASMVAQAYGSYIEWKDSVAALKAADEVAALKKQIADNESVISEQDSSLTARKMVIVGLCVLAAALAAALVVGGFVLLRFILLTRRQKKNIQIANENNAQKAHFISNISAQLEPTLRKLDQGKPEVQALNDFARHIQTLSDLENSMGEGVETENVQVPQFCESLMDEIRELVKPDVVLKVDAPKMSVDLNREYVSHILSHLLHNAAEYTADGGHIGLEFKKRGAHTCQFLVSNTGAAIPEEEREGIFKPFREVKDLTQGDGLGLPICRQMAIKMNGALDIDPQFVKGVRFILELHN